MKLVSAICRKKAIITKIAQFLGYFLLFIGLGYQTQRLYKKLKVEPEIFSKESSIQSSEIPFPAVTICPPYTIKKEAWNPEYLRLNNLTENDLYAAHLLTCKYDHEVITKYQKTDANLVDILLKTSPDFGDFFEHSSINNYNADRQDCEKIFTKSMTDKGICYTFNMIGHHSIFKNDISADFDMYKRTKVTKSWTLEDVMNEAHHDDKYEPQPPKWSLESGYTDNSDNIQPVRALKMQAMRILIQTVMNQTLCEGREKIFKIILHLPNEVPQLSYESIDYPIGKKEVILVSAEVTHNEDSLRVFPPTTRGCYFDGEKQLRFFESYTEANCEYECLSNFTYKSCGCVRFSMVHSDNMKVCDVNHGCTEDIIFSFPRSYYEDPENRKKHPHYPCGCLPSCNEIKYKVIKHVENENDYDEANLLSYIHIVFGESQIKKTSNYVTYEMENFVFDIGGLIGLFLGSSILSVLELLVNVCRAVKSRAERAFKWLKTNTEVKTTGSIYSVELESSVEHEEDIREHEVSDTMHNNRELRVFSTSKRQESSLAFNTVHESDLNVEDLEN